MQELKLTAAVLALGLVLSLALGLVLFLEPAAAVQAQRSMLCVTPTLLCKAVNAGPTGAPCSCKTYAGWVRGRLG